MSAETSVVNYEKALGKLAEFLNQPIQSERDMAGIIQAFEFTFERSWEACQSIAQDQGVEARSPKQALQAAVRLGILDPSDEEPCLRMLSNRNLTSHTYNAVVAEQVVNRTKDLYVPLFKKGLANMKR